MVYDSYDQLVLQMAYLAYKACPRRPSRRGVLHRATAYRIPNLPDYNMRMSDCVGQGTGRVDDVCASGGVLRLVGVSRAALTQAVGGVLDVEY